MAMHTNYQIRNEKIRLLKTARKLIETGQEYFICHAIDKARIISCLVQDGLTYIARNQLKGYIGAQLWPFDSLDRYLGVMHPPCRTSHELDRPEFERKICETRLAWIDWMINQLENQ